jgi:trans-aconitate methyltransferase
MTSELGSWHSREYVAEWVGDDVIADMLEFPRRLTVGIAADAGIDVSHVVDLGAGHGPYLELFLERFPSARGTWIDSSQPMQALARERLERFGDRVEYVVGDLERFAELAFDVADVVVSSRVLHHFSSDTLRALYARLYDQTAPGGLVANLDHVGMPGDWEQVLRRLRKQFLTGRQVEQKPHRHDHPFPLAEDQVEWLSGAGFDAPAVPWRMFYTALIVARKPALAGH